MKIVFISMRIRCRLNFSPCSAFFGFIQPKITKIPHFYGIFRKNHEKMRVFVQNEQTSFCEVSYVFGRGFEKITNEKVHIKKQYLKN